MSEKYDCTKDITEHRRAVHHFMSEAILRLAKRADEHDASKLQEPEKSMFDEFTPKLKEFTYGSPEYKQALKDMGAALAHHYENNSHHPEHFESGIDGMSLLDLLEMFCDWQAATLRHPGPEDDIMSIRKSAERFKMSPQLEQIFRNTLAEIW